MRLLLGLLMIGLFAPQTATVRVTVRLLGVRPDKGGVLHIGLHPAPGTAFPGPSPTENRDTKPLAAETVLTFDAVPGTYAVAVHHDANANGKVDVNFLGVPKEGYAVSNDVRPKFRAPRFNEASVVVTRDTILVVQMTY